MEENVQEDVEVESESPSKESFLPSWVLRMRSKIEESRQAHSNAESRLSQISLDVTSLSTKLDALRKDDSSRKNKNKVLGSLEANSLVADKKACMKIFHMPTDALNIFLQYLSLSSVYSMLSSSKDLRVHILNNPYWVHLYRTKF